LSTPNAHLIANSEAAKLVRKRRRHAREFARICRRIREIDARLVSNQPKCTPEARKQVHEQLADQESLMLDAITQQGPSPLVTKTHAYLQSKTAA